MSEDTIRIVTYEPVVLPPQSETDGAIPKMLDGSAGTAVPGFGDDDLSEENAQAIEEVIGAFRVREVSKAALAESMDELMDVVELMMTRMERRTETSDIKLDEVELSVVVNRQGQISLWGAGMSAGSAGAIKLKFKRGYGINGMDAILALQKIAIDKAGLPQIPSPPVDPTPNSPEPKAVESDISQSQPQPEPEPEIKLESEVGVDYSQLQKLLSEGKWREADEETARVMLKAAKRESEGWLDSESIEKFPCADLRTIDRLWVKYSDGRFGFSVQKRIYVECGAKLDGKYPGEEIWYKFCDKIGWRQNGEWMEYKNLTFSTSAPLGHLPGTSPFGKDILDDTIAVRSVSSSLGLELGKWVGNIGAFNSSLVRAANCNL